MSLWEEPHLRPKVGFDVTHELVVCLVHFLIAINDIILFTDYTTIYTKGQQPEEGTASANVIFVRAREWFRTNNLSFNDDKTQEMVCSVSRHSLLEAAVGWAHWLATLDMKYSCGVLLCDVLCLSEESCENHLAWWLYGALQANFYKTRNSSNLQPVYPSQLLNVKANQNFFTTWA